MSRTPLRNRPIAEWQEGDRVQGFAFLLKKELRQDRKGNSFLDLELRDASSSINAKAWSDSPALSSVYEACEFVAFEGQVQSFREELQLSLVRCRRAEEGDRAHGFDEDSLVPSSPHDLDALWRELEDVLGRRIAHPALRQLVADTLAVHGPALRQHPAAKSIHHAYRGGLLEHVVSMLGLAERVADHYPELDAELLLVGALYHDLGKLLELGAMPLNDYTPAGKLVGHIVLGRDLLRERCAAIPGFPPDLQLHLEHLVLSHQGRREYGCPVEPMTAEALALSAIDELDSKLAQLQEAATLGSGEAFAYLRPLGRQVLLPTVRPPTAARSPVTEDAGEAASARPAAAYPTRPENVEGREAGSLPPGPGTPGPEPASAAADDPREPAGTPPQQRHLELG